MTGRTRASASLFLLTFSIFTSACGEATNEASGTQRRSPTSNSQDYDTEEYFKGSTTFSEMPFGKTEELNFTTLYKSKREFRLGAVSMNDDSSFEQSTVAEVDVQETPFCRVADSNYDKIAYKNTTPRNSCAYMSKYTDYSTPSLTLYARKKFDTVKGKKMSICTGRPSPASKDFKNGKCALLIYESLECDDRGDSLVEIDGDIPPTKKKICYPTKNAANLIHFKSYDMNSLNVEGTLEVECDVQEIETSKTRAKIKNIGREKLIAEFRSRVIDRAPRCVGDKSSDDNDQDDD